MKAVVIHEFDGKLKTRLSAVHPLSDVHRVHAEMESGHTRGKIVFKIE